MTYLSKSNDSFKSRLRFFLFEKTLAQTPVNSSHLEEFLEYHLLKKKDITLKYTAEFYHTERGKDLPGTDLQIDAIYVSMKEAGRALKPELPKWRKAYFNKVFKQQFKESKFNELMEAEQCHYCEITLTEISHLIKNKKIYKKNERGWRMEIDRKEPNQEYTDENCVAACYWCNNAKTDEFNAEEFKPIGKAIGKALRARLSQ
jgi:5-methylcytosine-specific restriction endonuclease McrA